MFSTKISAIQADTDIVLLPEMFTTGFSMNTSTLAEDMGGSTVLWMKKMAANVNKVIAGSLMVIDEGNYYNRFIWMNPDGSYQFYDKKHLFRMAKEEAFYSSGTKQLVIDYKGWKIRPLICYDLRFPVWSRNKNINKNDRLSPNYDVVLYVANWPEVRVSAWDVLLRARAMENQAYCLGVNRVGTDGSGKEYVGHSAAIDPKGNYLLDPVHTTEGTYTVSLDKNSLEGYRNKFPQGLDADNFELTQ
jgi:omega-amidase